MKNTITALSVLCTSLAFGQSTLVLQPDSTTGQDAAVYDCVPCGYPNANFSELNHISSLAWTHGGNPSNVRSFLKFDLSDLPPGTTINSAYLSLSYAPINQEGDQSSLTRSNESVIRKVMSPWDHTSITWNNQPGASSVDEVYIPESTSPSQDYPNLDVTNLVQGMVDDPINNFGFKIQLVDENQYARLVFASSEYADPKLRPKLEINYSSTIGINEFADQERVLLGIYDILGRETVEQENTLLIYRYSDGSTEKVYRAE